MGLFGRKRRSNVVTLAPRQDSAAPRASATLPGPLAPRYAPGSEIGYYPDLIGRFEKTHAALLMLYTEVTNQVQGNEFADALKSLGAFKRALTGHLLEENIKLYTYLAKCLASDPDTHDLMVAMKAEMGKIGSAVMACINDYVRSGITPFNKQAFLDQWRDIGAALVDRIEREETSLYTMYLPPSAFDQE